MARKNSDYNSRLRIVSLCLLGIAIWIIAHLFKLQIIEHGYYSLFASNSHEIYQKLHPERGKIFFQDTRNHQVYPVAINRQYYLLYAVPKEIASSDISTTTNKLVQILDYTDNSKTQELIKRLSKSQSLYQVVERKVPEEKIEQIKDIGLKGIYFTPQQFRYYPEENTGAPLLGFCSRDDQDNTVGKYGIEGYWNKELTGKLGFIAGERGRWGSWITLVGRRITPAENGADLVLTIDRTLQYQACKRLEEGRVAYKAKTASLIMMNPKTGAILAMCSSPDFNPNSYSKVGDVSYYNNTAIFNAYEPGSVFKPITMAIALDLGLVNPGTTFTDPCKREFKNTPRPIYNALRKCYGIQTMTQVLEKSINTGIIWVVEHVGLERFTAYVEKFGFGKKTGITLNTEVAGNISSLYKKLPVNSAYASFGQGITVTPLQLAAAYSALAHEGKLPKPYIVEEIRHQNGKTDKTKPEIVQQVISPRTAKLISGMLTSTVESTYYRTVKLPNFYIAAKTGTAQIAEKGRYDETRTNHTLAGFAPAGDAQFVLVIKYEEPELPWAESTAGPVFKDIMKFALDYYGIPQER